jgi:hypothetical protein
LSNPILTTPPRRFRSVESVQHGPEIELLPKLYRRALELEREGHDCAAIARELGVPIESMRALLEIGHAKLARLAGGSPGSPRPGETDSR